MKATAVDTENGSFPPDAQVQDSEEDVPVLSLSRSVPSGMERRPEFRLGTANRFEALTDEATSSYNVKKRVRDQDSQCAESQHNELLDVLAFDLTIEDTDTESVFEEKAIRNESTRRKLVFVNGTQQNSCDGEDTSEGEVEDLVEHEECEENQSEPGEESEEGSDKELEPDLLFVPQRRSMTTGFASLDMVDLEQVFEIRALVMKSVPTFMKGAFRGALKVSLEEIKRG